MLKTWNDQSPDLRSDDDPGDQHCEQGASARTARDYQINLVDNLEEILARSDYAYLEAPTGTGKTVVMAMLARSLGIGEVYYLAHTIDLLKQARASLAELVEEGLADPAQRWHFLTWRKYVSSCIKGLIDKDTPHIALVDECHMGGAFQSATQQKRCFPVIRSMAHKTVWISATPWMLNESTMGQRQNHTAFYGYQSAFDSGHLNSVDLVRVDCSLKLELKLSDEYRDLTRAFQHEKSNIVIDEDCADSTFEKLTRRVQELAGRGLRPRDVPALVEHRYRLMANLYQANHSGSKAIFWLPSKAHARARAQYINTIFGTPDYATAILGESRAGQGADEIDPQLQAWRDPHGSTKIACVVYRLREGFDYPELHLGFDCAWNPYNYRNAIQKIGRLIRKADRKPGSTYYYAVDALSVAVSRSRQYYRSFLDPMREVYAAEDELTFSLDTLADVAMLKTNISPDGQFSTTVPKRTAIRLAGIDIPAERVPLFDVEFAAGSIQHSRIELSSFSKGNSTLQAEALVEDIIQGRAKLRQYGDLSQVEERLKNLLSPSFPGHRPDLRARLIASGHLQPRAARIEATRAKLEGLLCGIESGEVRWNSRHPDWKWLEKYSNPTCNCFRPEVRERLIKCGALKPAGPRLEAKVRLNLVMEKVLASQKLPPQKSPDRAFLNQYLSRRSPKFDALVRKKVEHLLGKRSNSVIQASVLQA